MCQKAVYVYVFVYVDVLMLLFDAYVYAYVHIQGIVSEDCIRISCSATADTLLPSTFLLVTSLFFDVGVIVSKVYSAFAFSDLGVTLRIRLRIHTGRRVNRLYTYTYTHVPL
jgi:hypothetical protein